MPKQAYSLDACLKESARTGEGYFGSAELGFEVAELSADRSRGVQTVTLYCGTKSTVVIPTRGMGVWNAHCGDIRFGWDSPIQGPIHPQWVNLGEPTGLGWLDGFDELLVRCGMVNNGAPEFSSNGVLKWPLHGRVGNLPATDVKIEIDESSKVVSISGTVVEARFLFYRWSMHTTISMSFDSPEIRIVDRVENQSNRPGTFQMLYHCNFGPPVLESGSRLFARTAEVSPRDDRATTGFATWDTYCGPDPAYTEQVYFLKLIPDENGNCFALLSNRNRELGAYVKFAVDQLPYFTLWKNTVGSRDGYVTGLEPGTNYPNPRSIEEAAGRVVSVAPGESVSLNCAIGMLVDAAAVEQTINRIQGTQR